MKKVPALEFGYTNWKGEFGRRRVQPIRWYHGSTEWHPDPQWLMKAYDTDKKEIRVFAVKDMVFDGAQEARLAACHDALCKISLAEADSTTAASDKVRDMARLARSVIAGDSAQWVDRLPAGHVVIEQAEMMDGRVSQTVEVSGGAEYQRIVSAEEAYGPDEGDAAPSKPAQGPSVEQLMQVLKEVPEWHDPSCAAGPHDADAKCNCWVSRKRAVLSAGGEG